MDILYLIDRLESVIGSGYSLPLGNKVVVDGKLLLELVDQMRVSVPDELRDAQELLRSREGIIAEAEETARRLAREAQERLDALIQQSEVTKVAETRASETVSEAERNAEEFINNAKREAQEQKRLAALYSLDLLRKLESHLSVHLATVEGGIKALEAASAYREEAPETEEHGISVS